MESLNNSLLARLGWKMTSNQSLSWVDSLRGLLKNRRLVEKGACISISSGVNVNVWNSPWIPLKPKFSPTPNANLVNFSTFTVVDLMIPGRQVPSCAGVFSMKSAYDLSFTMGGRPSHLSSKAWLVLWVLKLQARLKHLLWKVAWDILPSRDKIGRPISDWVIALLSPVAALGIPKVDVRKFQLFASLTMNFIWRARNLLIHEGTQPSPSSAIFQISNTFNHHNNAWRDLALPFVWTPPIADLLKGNFDVAVKGFFVVAVVVISDENGFIFATAIQKLVSTNVLQGEAHAALLVVLLAASLDLGPLSVEMDAILIA
ncbi:uncharacterized protein LOC132181296 [Corylus avellana]|uniref:uncharacterized protein LOC132181296 n=1 Tax=Corylus avellana TaxID=13451 RepID=UPI00286A7DB4|nr:uncharacterized protein LOC132181296 [Corylus avellana]